MAPDVVSKETALYWHVRSITAAALLAFAGVIAVGVAVLLPGIGEQPLGARGLPWMAAHRASIALEVPSASENAPPQSPVEPQQAAAPEQPRGQPQQAALPEQPFIETQQIATQAATLRTPSDMQWPELLRGDATLPEQATLIPPRAVEQAPAVEGAAEPAPAAQPPATDTAATEPATETRMPERTVAPKAQARLPARKPAGEAQAPAAAAKMATRRVQTAKKSTNDALNAVRKFGEGLRDIPVSSYSADGTRREIVIHPRSIQDVYYYSAPR